MVSPCFTILDADLCSPGPVTVVVYLFVVLCGSEENATHTLFDIYCLIYNLQSIV